MRPECQRPFGSRGLTVVTSLDGVDLSGYSAVYVNCNNRPLSKSVRDSLVTFVQEGGHVYISDLAARDLTEMFPGKVNFNFNRITKKGKVTASTDNEALRNAVGPNVDLLFDLAGRSAVESIASDVTVYFSANVSSLSGPDGRTPITVGFRPQSNSGCVIYTSYHIEGASTGAPQEQALKYLVRNIDGVCR